MNHPSSGQLTRFSHKLPLRDRKSPRGLSRTSIFSHEIGPHLIELFAQHCQFFARAHMEPGWICSSIFLRYHKPEIYTAALRRHRPRRSNVVKRSSIISIFAHRRTAHQSEERRATLFSGTIVAKCRRQVIGLCLAEILKCAIRMESFFGNQGIPVNRRLGDIYRAIQRLRPQVANEQLKGSASFDFPETR